MRRALPALLWDTAELKVGTRERGDGAMDREGLVLEI